MFKSMCMGINTKIFHYIRPREEYIESHQSHQLCHSTGVSSSNTFLFRQTSWHQGLLMHDKPKRKGIETNICGQESSVIQSTKARDLSHCSSPRLPFRGKSEDVFLSILNFFLVFWNCRSSHRTQIANFKAAVIKLSQEYNANNFFIKRKDRKLKCTQLVIGKIVDHHINLH